MFAIEWGSGTPSGTVDVEAGSVEALYIERGEGSVDGKTFHFKSDDGRLHLDISSADEGASRTIVTVDTESDPFSFFPTDVDEESPIWIPEYEVTVTTDADQRNYREIAEDLRESGGLTNLQQINESPEESYQQASEATVDMTSPTWLGLSRDIRIFGMGFRNSDPDTNEERLWDWIRPRFHGHGVTPPSMEHEVPSPYRVGDEVGPDTEHDLLYKYMLGRGIGPVQDISRHLESGCLPILHGDITDGDIAYETTSFVSLERRPLSADTVEGTHHLVADSYGLTYMQTDEQLEQRDEHLPAERDRDEETVLYFQATAVNTGSVPRYAHFKNVAPNTDYTFDGSTGTTRTDGPGSERDEVFTVSKFNGEPLSQEEVAVLLEPGEQATLEFYVPHRPVSPERAIELGEEDFDNRHRECRAYWEQKLDDSADIALPETRIQEMTEAGLLHLDLVSYGSEPDGTVTPTIGVYPAIGSESAPIVQFFDSMGLHDLARRCLSYFLEKQHDDGFMQNFGAYMLETGAVLWSLGEHYRYTRDEEWVEEIKSDVLNSCDYLIEWREDNKSDSEELGDGLVRGKTADPDDPYRSFMLNGYSYLGLSRAAEMLRGVDADRADEIQAAAEAYKVDIQEALSESMGRSPVVPLGDGRWCPTAPPWTEHRGPLSLFADGENWYTHGTFHASDSLLGPLWLVAQEVIDPTDRVAGQLLESHSELMTQRNVAFSQPYYSPHTWLHLRRSEPKRFLKAYYNAFASLADRETYSFWEHYFHASPHKTHEEGWFLMQTRWMLYLEAGETLSFFRGIPRSWMEDGQSISLEEVATYFGPVSIRVKSELAASDQISATVDFESDRRSEAVEVRLPHPKKKQPVEVVGGDYDHERETVTIAPVEETQQIVLKY